MPDMIEGSDATEVDMPVADKPAEAVAAEPAVAQKPISSATLAESSTPDRKPTMTEVRNGSSNDPLEGVAATRDTIFDKLVSHDGDVVGLLAYSLSKQNKRDWLAAFRAIKGRDPDSIEMDAFDIGEGIDRRIGTYRKLAEVALTGEPFWASSTVTPVSEMSGVLPTATPEQAMAPPSETPMAAFSQPARTKDGWFTKKR